MHSEHFSDARHLPPASRPAGTTASVTWASATTHRHGKVEILTITGELDMFTSPQVREEIHRCLANRPELLVIDLTAVTFLGVAGLALVAQASAVLHTALRVVAHQRAVVRPIEITGLGRKLVLFDTVEQALVAE
jgi:anti-anti-sigma factor